METHINDVGKRGKVGGMAAVARQYAEKLIGEQFGHLTITGILPREETVSRGYGVFCRVDCDCGNKGHVTRLKEVLNGKARSCGHCGAYRKKERTHKLRHTTEDTARECIGKRFGKLVITGIAGRKAPQGGKQKIVYVTCDCDCGTKGKEISFDALRWRGTKSCGCIRTANLKPRKKTVKPVEKPAPKPKAVIKAKPKTLPKPKPVKPPKVVRPTAADRAQELVGKRFGMLTVKGVAGNIVKPGTKTKNLFLLCDCDCGTKDHLVAKYGLVHGKAKSCGCMKGGHMANRLKKADGKAIETAIKKAKAAPAKKKTTSLYTTDPLTNGGRDLSARRLFDYWEGLDKETLCLAWQTPDKFAAWGIRNGFVNGRKLVRRDTAKKHNPVNSYWR